MVKPSPVLVLAALGLAAVAAGPALAAPGTGWFGNSAPERAAADFLRSAGLEGADALPRIPTDTTDFMFCSAERDCHTPLFQKAEHVSFGLVPLYAGSVTLALRMGGQEKAALRCEVPGECAVLATSGSRASPFQVIGKPSPGSTGGYVLWVSYG